MLTTHPPDSNPWHLPAPAPTNTAPSNLCPFRHHAPQSAEAFFLVSSELPPDLESVLGAGPLNEPRARSLLASALDALAFLAVTMPALWF